MFWLSNLLQAISWVLGTLSFALKAILIVNALLSWVRPDPNNPVVRFLDTVTEAVCDPIRRVIPTVIGGLDLAPMIAIGALYVFDIAIVSSLTTLAFRVG